MKFRILKMLVSECQICLTPLKECFKLIQKFSASGVSIPSVRIVNYYNRQILILTWKQQLEKYWYWVGKLRADWDVHEDLCRQ